VLEVDEFVVLAKIFVSWVVPVAFKLLKLPVPEFIVPIFPVVILAVAIFEVVAFVVEA